MARAIFWVEMAYQLKEYLLSTGMTIRALSKDAGVPTLSTLKLLRGFPIKSKSLRLLCKKANLSIDAAMYPPMKEKQFLKINEALSRSDSVKVAALCKTLPTHLAARYLCWGADIAFAGDGRIWYIWGESQKRGVGREETPPHIPLMATPHFVQKLSKRKSVRLKRQMDDFKTTKE